MKVDFQDLVGEEICMNTLGSKIHGLLALIHRTHCQDPPGFQAKVGPHMINRYFQYIRVREKLCVLTTFIKFSVYSICFMMRTRSLSCLHREPTIAPTSSSEKFIHLQRVLYGPNHGIFQNFGTVRHDHMSKTLQKFRLPFSRMDKINSFT